jgi:hypothetical protein
LPPKKLVSRLVTLENQIRGLAVVLDYAGGVSKCGHRRVRTLLYEVGNVMLTRNTGQLKLKDWPFGIAKRSTMRKARIAPARRRAHDAAKWN